MADADFKKNISLIDDAVLSFLPETGGETAENKEMLTYSLEGGGKRVRPYLALLFCEAAGGEIEKALPFGAAVEYIHTYSLIHDDLPCMDDDDLRRGRPSSHKAFGEANALLAGDALLTHAFYILTDAHEKGLVSAESALRAVREMSRLAGAAGMVGGQYIDLKYEGKKPSADVLFQMDALKTGALIEAACVLGLLAAGASEDKIDAAREFAKNLGLAFQIKDDILEYEDENDNSDIENEKSTYITEFGIEKAKELASFYTDKAIHALNIFGERGSKIREFALLLLRRTT